MPTTFSTGLSPAEKAQAQKREHLFETYKTPLGAQLIDFGGFVELQYGADPYFKVKFIPWPDEGILIQAKKAIQLYGPFMILTDVAEKCLKLLIPFDKINQFKIMKRPIKIVRPQPAKKREEEPPVLPTPPLADPGAAPTTDIQSQTLKSNQMATTRNGSQEPSEELLNLKSMVGTFLRSLKIKYVSVIPNMKTGNTCAANIKRGQKIHRALDAAVANGMSEFVEQTGETTLRFKVGFTFTEESGSGAPRSKRTPTTKKAKAKKSAKKKTAASAKVTQKNTGATGKLSHLSATLRGVADNLDAHSDAASGYTGEEIWEKLFGPGAKKSRITYFNPDDPKATIQPLTRKEVLEKFSQK